MRILRNVEMYSFQEDRGFNGIAICQRSASIAALRCASDHWRVKNVYRTRAFYALYLQALVLNDNHEYVTPSGEYDNVHLPAARDELWRRRGYTVR